MIPVIQPAPMSSETTNLQANPPLFPTPDLPQNIVPGEMMATLYLFKRIQPQGESKLQQIIPLAVQEGTTWARTKMGQLLFGVYQSTACRMISPSPTL